MSDRKLYGYEDPTLISHRFCKDRRSNLQILNNDFEENNVVLELETINKYKDGHPQIIYLYMNKNTAQFIFGQAIARAIDSSIDTRISYDTVYTDIHNAELVSLYDIIKKTDSSIKNIFKSEGPIVVLSTSISINIIDQLHASIGIHYDYGYMNKETDSYNKRYTNILYQPITITLTMQEMFDLITFVSNNIRAQ